MKTSKLLLYCLLSLQAPACSRYSVPVEKNEESDDRIVFGLRFSAGSGSDYKTSFPAMREGRGMLVFVSQEELNPSLAGRMSKVSPANQMYRSFGALGYVRNSPTRTPDYMYDEQIGATGEVEQIQGVLWRKYVTENNYPDPDGGAELYFYGYSPYGIKELTLSPRNHPGVPYLYYSVPGNIMNQHDLVVGSSTRDWSGASSAFVAMEFRHVLTQVNIFVDETNTAGGVVTKIVLRNILSEGRIELDASGSTAQKATDFPVEKIYVPFEPGCRISLLGDGNSFMMMPQQCTGSIYVELLVEGQTYKCECSLKGDEWKAGKVTNYYLKFNIYEQEDEY